MNADVYSRKVADFYDREACGYEERYWKNIIAQRIRQCFREEVKSHSFVDVLEIGCGTGLDACHFASIYPNKKVYAIDIAPAMVARATRKAEELGLGNVRIWVGTPETLHTMVPNIRFDLIYSFFGALNTVPDLRQTAQILSKHLKPHGRMVLTFVNKWYLADMLIDVSKLRFKSVLKRVREVWDGYSCIHKLESRCFSPLEIKAAFEDEFDITRSQGYSIFYPAWYRVHLVPRLGRKLSDLLWKIDRILNHTPAWCLGEYALYSFRVKSNSFS